MTRYLINGGVNASVATADGNTLLHLLFVGGEEMDRLERKSLVLDVIPRARNLVGETPLHTVRQGFVTIFVRKNTTTSRYLAYLDFGDHSFLP